jgi:hypothetical protein
MKVVIVSIESLLRVVISDTKESAVKKGSGGMVLLVLTVPGVSPAKLSQLRTHCRHNVFAVVPLHIKERRNRFKTLQELCCMN